MALNEHSKLLDTTSVCSKKENAEFAVGRMRYFMAFLCWFSLVVSYTMKVNMNIAIVDMVSTSGHDSKGNVFGWNSTTQGIILSSFFWGYAITQIPGGVFASRYGTKICLTFGTLTNVVLAFLTPICTIKGGEVALVFVRFIGGFCMGLTFPCYVVFWSKWSPTFERSMLQTITYSGIYCGSLITFVLGGQIVQRFGWPILFYTSGLIGVVWTILWLVFASDAPEDNKFISHSEKVYIMENRGNVRHFLPVKEIPWKHLLTSLPFLSIVLVSFCYTWGNITMMTQLPTYMKRVFGFDTKQSGAISGAPYAVQAIVIIISGYLSDYVIKKSMASTKVVRRFCVCFGALVQATSLVLIANIENSTTTITFLIFGTGLGIVMVSGYKINVLDLAPNIVGPLMGIANFSAALSAILVPLVIGLTVKDQTSFGQWNVAFYISAGLYVLSCTVFGCFSSGDEQHWNNLVTF